MLSADVTSVWAQELILNFRVLRVKIKFCFVHNACHKNNTYGGKNAALLVVINGALNSQRNNCDLLRTLVVVNAAELVATHT